MNLLLYYTGCQIGYRSIKELNLEFEILMGAWFFLPFFRAPIINKS